jgi:hypothetical protein
MTTSYPDWGWAARQNLAYDEHYGQHKSVDNPVWAGAEGDKAALLRATYESAAAQSYFQGPVYNQQFRTMVSTALQGKGRTMFDRVQLTGMDDYYTYGRNEKEYSMVSAYSLSSADYMIAVGAIGAALLFFIVFK